jgi:hypothetical protein
MFAHESTAATATVRIKTASTSGRDASLPLLTQTGSMCV